MRRSTKTISRGGGATRALATATPGLASGSWVRDPNTKNAGTVTLDASGNGTTSHHVAQWGTSDAAYTSGPLQVTNGSTVGIVSTGTIHVKWNWQSSDGTPPPANVVVKKTASASWSGPKASVTGTTDNGLDNPRVPDANAKSETMSGSAYEAKDSSSGVVDVSWPASASVHATGSSAANTTGNVKVAVSGDAELIAASLDVAGTVAVGNQLKALVGQNQVASVSVSGFDLKNHVWSVGGDVQPFLYLRETGTERKYMYRSLIEANPHPTTKSFYASKPNIETVQCSVDLYLPGTTTFVANVTLQRYVDVKAPDATLVIGPAYMTPPGAYNVGSGAVAIAGSPQSVSIAFSTTVPSPFVGDMEAILQKVVMSDTFQPSNDHQGFKVGRLDNAFPYLDSEQDSDTSYTTYDAPSAVLGSDTSFSVNRSYRTSTMYRPLGDGAVYVPIVTKGWTWIMSGYKNGSGNWVCTGGLAFTSGAGTPFSLDDAEYGNVYVNGQSYPFPSD